MIIDILKNADRYSLNSGISKAFHWLQSADLKNIAPGKYEIEGEALFALVQEYETSDPATEQMEAHKKYIDVQYIIAGQERVGHAILKGQAISKAYNEAEDFMLFSDAPAFFSIFEAGMFMIFFPTDLHMPCIKNEQVSTVKKVVLKVGI